MSNYAAMDQPHSLARKLSICARTCRKSRILHMAGKQTAVLSNVVGPAKQLSILGVPLARVVGFTCPPVDS